MIACENDGFAESLSGFITQTVLHQVSQNGSVGVTVVDELVNFFRRIIVISRIFALIFKFLNLFISKHIQIDSLT